MRTGKSILGRFILLVGLILLVIFFATDQSKNPSYAYFCLGVVAAILGVILLFRGHKPPAESMRFRTVRRWRDQLRQRKEDKKKQPF